MEEIKIKYNEEYIPLSIFMQTEKYKVIPCTANNQVVYEISNYGNLRSTNRDTGYHGSSFSKTNRCNIIVNDGRVRVFTAAIVLNTFLGEEFNIGDHIAYADGDTKNTRLDNIEKVPAGTASPVMTINTMRTRFPDRVTPKKKKVEQEVNPVNIRSSKLLYNAFKQTILDMFVKSGIPTPISLLYKNAVESSKEIKDIIDFGSFCSLIATKSPIEGDYGQVFLEPANNDMVPRTEMGYISFRLAVILRECYGEKMFYYRKKFVVDRENSIIVDFLDTDRMDSSKFINYPAPSYIELIDFLIKNNNVFINANYQFDKDLFEGVIINCENGETSYVYSSDRYDVALENTIVKYLCEKFELNAEPEIETENSVETLVDE